MRISDWRSDVCSSDLQYEVRSPLIKRYAAVVYIRRDLDSALEMIRACAADEQCTGSPLARRCLWISAVATYAKALMGGKGRTASDADGYVTMHMSKERIRLQDYLMNLRYRMSANHDIIGDTKNRPISLTPHTPLHTPPLR